MQFLELYSIILSILSEKFKKIYFGDLHLRLLSTLYPAPLIVSTPDNILGPFLELLPIKQQW